MADFDTRDAKRTNALFRGRTSYEDLFYLCEEMTIWRIGLADNSTLTSFMKAIERRARPPPLGGEPREPLLDHERQQVDVGRGVRVTGDLADGDVVGVGRAHHVSPGIGGRPAAGR